MVQDLIEFSRNGYARLRSAADDFARAEIARLVGAVIDDLRARPANDTFGDVAARHLWDEYCWSLQEGPFDDDMSWDDVRLGSLSGAFDDVLSATIQTEVEKLPKHALIFLSARAFEEHADSGDADVIGSIWIEGIVSLVLEEVNGRASCRKITLIGPERGDEIPYEITGSGLVWSVLSERGEATEILAGHCDALLDVSDDLSELAHEFVEAFMTVATEEDQGEVLPFLLERFDDEIRALVREKDVVPCLEDLRAELFDLLDD